MTKYTASWRLNSALGNMGAPTKIINRKSSIFQAVLEDVKYGHLSPEEGAKYLLKAVHQVFDAQNSAANK